MSANGGISWTPAGASLVASCGLTNPIYGQPGKITGCTFCGAVSSGDGSTVVVFGGGYGGTAAGYSYTSHDSGATWTRGDTKKVWSVYSFQMSCDGMKLTAIGRPESAEQGDVSKNILYTSADAGHTWMAATQPPASDSSGGNSYGGDDTPYWWQVVLSSDGSKVGSPPAAARAAPRAPRA